MEDAIERERQALANFFQPQARRFQLEGVIGYGAFGATFKLIEFSPEDPPMTPRNRKRKFRSITPQKIASSISGAWQEVKRRRINSPGDAIRIFRRQPLSPATPPSASVASLSASGPDTPGTPGRTYRSLNPAPRRILRRLCLKRTIDEDGEDDLRSEIRTLRAINGSQHVIGLIAYRDDPEPVAAQLRVTTPWPRVGPIQETVLSGLAGPVVIMEYMENGTLARVAERLGRGTWQGPIPNRFLWAIYLCGIRACIATAYQLGFDLEADPILETIWPARQPVQLAHGDLHYNNIMFGDADPTIQEHSLIPILKWIDFGAAHIHADEDGEGVERNILDVSNMINCLITGTEPDADEMDVDEMDAVDLAPDMPGLDEELQDLIRRGRAVDFLDRPSLADMFFRTYQAVTNRNEAFYRNSGLRESDDDIREFVQTLIYNPDP
ncbi:hypothetical protein F5Y16DRAFT_386728 [Xylariaceae sp. FL0255]|nr:hypothetical protein F5Y16DRAFT_386728 [Xylariaceae sp. FL0255]